MIAFLTLTGDEASANSHMSCVHDPPKIIYHKPLGAKISIVAFVRSTEKFNVVTATSLKTMSVDLTFCYVIDGEQFEALDVVLLVPFYSFST